MRLNGIEIGSLDKKFVFETPTYTIDTITNEKKITTWNTYATVWGKWLKMSNEKFEADQQVTLNEGKIMIRYLDGLQETMRVNDGGVYHYIKGIESIDRNVSQTIRTEKRDNV